MAPAKTGGLRLRPAARSAWAGLDSTLGIFLALGRNGQVSGTMGTAFAGSDANRGGGGRRMDLGCGGAVSLKRITSGNGASSKSARSSANCDFSALLVLATAGVTSAMPKRAARARRRSSSSVEASASRDTTRRISSWRAASATSSADGRWREAGGRETSKIMQSSSSSSS